MAKYQKEWAKRQRKLLLWFLGEECKWCGAKTGLEFDCIKPRGDEHHKFDTSARMCFYRKQLLQFNLQILCESCHCKKTSQEQRSSYFWEEIAGNQPF